MSDVAIYPLPVSIFQLIPLAMAEIGGVKKERKNLQQGYQFRGIDDFLLACQPAMSHLGIFVATRVVGQQREERQTQKGGTLFVVILTVEHRFYGPDGTFVEVITVGEAMDSGDKATNKAMSAALKYALLQTFCIPTDDPEVDTEFHSPSPQPKSAPPTRDARPPGAPSSVGGGGPIPATTAPPVLELPPTNGKPIGQSLAERIESASAGELDDLAAVTKRSLELGEITQGDATVLRSVWTARRNQLRAGAA